MATISQYCAQYSKDKNAIRMRFKKAFPDQSFSVGLEISEAQAAVLFAKEIAKGGAKSEAMPGESSAKNEREKSETNRENIFRPETKAETARKEAARKEARKRVALFCVLSFCVVGITAHCAMVTFEARQVWSLPGLLAGFVISFCVLFIVALSAVRERAEVSAWAVWCIAPVNAICARVHYLYFNRTSPENGWDNVLIACAVPVIAWLLEYLFREIVNYQPEQ